MGPSNKPVTVSVVVLAYNEAGNLPKAVNAVINAAEGCFSDYEILIVDDGSRDDTPLVAEKLAEENAHIKSIQNGKNMGCSYTFWHGVKEARFDYIWLIPGDGEIPQESLVTIAENISTAEMLLPYMVNSSIRPWYRRLISWGYTSLLNILFLKHIRYYNGPAVYPAKPLCQAPVVASRGFQFMAPIIVTLIRKKVSWKQVGIMLKEREFGKPTMSNFKNIFSALRILSRFWWKFTFNNIM